MKTPYLLALSLLLAACSSFSDSQVIMKASPEERLSKSPLPTPEKPLQAPHIDDKTISIAPQIGVRLPLGK